MVLVNENNINVKFMVKVYLLLKKNMPQVSLWHIMIIYKRNYLVGVGVVDAGVVDAGVCVG
jgi:hypothetical protein